MRRLHQSVRESFFRFPSPSSNLAEDSSVSVTVFDVPHRQQAKLGDGWRVVLAASVN